MKQRIIVAVLLLCSGVVENALRVGVLFHSNNGHLSQNWTLPNDMSGSTHGIAEEREGYYYDIWWVDGKRQGTMYVYSEIGKHLEPFFRGLPITVAIPGAMNEIAYYANFANCIDEYGLTDSAIAHSPLNKRGRIGHEKTATDEYLHSRLVDFELQQVVPTLLKDLNGFDLAFQIQDLGLWQMARLICYDSSHLNALSRRLDAADNDSRLPLYQYIIPQYISEVLPTRPLDRLEEDYAGFQRFYFSRYPDSNLIRPFEERIKVLKIDSVNGKAI